MKPNIDDEWEKEKKTMDGGRHLKRFQHQVSPIGKKCMDVRKSWRDIWQKKKTPDVERGKYKIVERIVWWGRINSGSNAYMGGATRQSWRNKVVFQLGSWVTQPETSFFFNPQSQPSAANLGLS